MPATARTRILAGALVLTMGVLGLTGAASARTRFTATPIHQGRTYHAAKALSARLAKTDRHLLRLHGNRLVPVMVKFDVDPAASYTGGVAGYRATSPSITGRALAKPTAAVSSYVTYLKARESSIVRAIAARVSGVRTLATYQIVYGGASMLVPAGRIGQLLHVPGVVAVQANRLTHPLSDDTQFIGADAVWPSLGGQTRAGDNVIVGDLDTGIWPENPLFADHGLPPFPGTFGCQFGDGSDPLLGPTFACNDKLIGAYAFTDTYMAVIGALPGEFCDNGTGQCSTRDADGHGTHTASTAAGSSSQVTLLGIKRRPVSGMAPGARIIAYRVCMAQGCFQSDSVAAIQQAILDGVNVINFSISGGANPYQDAVELAFLDAYAAGIDVNAAAGNAGPGPETADHGGPWVTTVGASYGPKFFLTTLRLRSGAGTFSLQLSGSTITQGIQGKRVELAADVAAYGDPLCQTPMDPGTATGLVVVCERGVNGRNEKSFNVMQGGAAGMILYNPTHMDLFSDNFWIPTVMLDGPEPANSLLAFLAAHTVVHAWWKTGFLEPVHADQMTTFSSRGPVGNFIKPDVTAPGIQILEGNTPEPIDVASGPAGELFQAIAGTSMSTPHATGVSALVAAVHPDWTPGQIKSALMTSSVQDVTKEDGVTPADPFDAGAGSIRADRAVNPTLTFDVAAADYAAAAGDPLGEVDLNLPSIDETTMPGDISTKRFGLNVSGSSQTFSASTTAPAGASIDVTSPSWTVAAGGTLEIDVTISGEDLPDGQYFGSIVLHPASGANDVYLPVAFVKTQGSVTLSNTCDPTTIIVGASSACQATVENLSPSASNVSLQVNSPDSPDLAIANVSAPGVTGGNGFTFSGPLSGAVAPTIDSIDPGGSPAGYLPLASLGVAPLSGVGDETITDLGVPSYQYGSETYDQVGLVSDGYAVVGGGDSTDVNFFPQTLPDPTRPNNVIAPFWTDLNPSSAGNMYAADVTDGVNHWVVLEWAGVQEFSVPATVSFEIWLQEGSTESVTFAYGADVPSSGDPGSALEVGAENRDGSSGFALSSVPAAGSDWTVVTSPPAAGGSVTITYDAVGNAEGNHPLIARMTSDQVPGTTVEKTVISVTT